MLSYRQVGLAAFLLFALAGCGPSETPKPAATPAHPAAAAPAPVPAASDNNGDPASRLGDAANIDGDRIIHADATPGDWLAHGRTYSEQRYSPLKDINADTVKQLGVAWEFRTNTVRGLESTPIVSDGIMFVTGSWSNV